MDPSTVHRQRQLDTWAGPRDAQDIVGRLGDTNDTQYPVFRNTTLTTLVLDGETSQLRIWQNGNPRISEPKYTWNLAEFFKQAHGSA